jgi:RNA polymerase sigma factor (sigma-70 family)
MPAGHVSQLMPTLRRVVLARQAAARSDGELVGAFVAARDADAFAELVRRHGPMVLGVCRRVVGDRAAADDAFQAVFLVLVRRAAAVRPRERVGNWLYGVAYRTALKARSGLARRRAREKQVLVMPEPTAPAPPDWTDLQPVLDEELARLPDRLRLPVVLCDLEGRPQREVARHLNVPPATLATRLAAARRTLARRLTRRGVALSGGALAGLLGSPAAAPAVHPALAAGLVRAVETAAAGGALSPLVSANAVHLSEGVMRMIVLAKLKALAVLTATALVLTTGLGLGLVPAAADDNPPPRPGVGRSGPDGPAPAAPANPIDRAVADRLDKLVGEAAGADDATFLRRLCLDARGTPPTDVETWFFVSDGDDDKRTKLVEWLTEDDATQAALAKKLGVTPDRVRVIRVRLAPDGKRLVAIDDRRAAEARAAAVIPDGGSLLTGRLKLADALEVALSSPAADKKPGGALARVEADGPAEPVVVADPDRSGVRLWADLTGKAVKGNPERQTLVWAFDGDQTARLAADVNEVVIQYLAALPDPDAEFLKRVLTDVRGNGPTALELRYFTADKDPKKREKLVDTLLTDPAVLKKLGDAWKAKVLARQGDTPALNAWLDRGGASGDRQWRVILDDSPPVPPPAPQPNKLQKLVDELVAAKKSDEAIFEAVTIATLGRLPTAGEKKIVLAGIGTVTDRKAAWAAVAKALAAEEPKKTGEVELKVQLDPRSVPPAKP